LQGEICDFWSSIDEDLTSLFYRQDCNKDWVFTAGEQEFYSQKEFENEPIRCKECRKARKIARFRRNRSAKKEDAAATSGDAAAAPATTAATDKPKSARAPRTRRAAPASGDKPKAASTAPRVCFAFQKNECTRGDSCKFAHVAASA
jgi:hypothetical protein